MNKTLKHDLLLILGLGLILIPGWGTLLYYNYDAWMPDHYVLYSAGSAERLVQSFGISFSSILPMLLFFFLFLGVYSYFGKNPEEKKANAKRAIISAVLLAVLIAWTFFASWDRAKWAEKVNGLIYVKYVPLLTEHQACEKDDLLEAYIEGDYISVRCGDAFYPFYEEYRVPTITIDFPKMYEVQEKDSLKTEEKAKLEAEYEALLIEFL